MKETLVLFDVDGTLTEARRPIQKRMMRALRELARHAEIGFVTGSGVEYIKEQLWPVLNDPIVRNNCHLLPCNGTEYIIPHGDEEIIFQTLSTTSMSKRIGKKHFNMLMKMICTFQSDLVNEYDIPLSGHFVQNRSSMINWCPIGRNANQESRDEFKALDKLHKIRNKFIKELKFFAIHEGIELTIKLGGNTSFDIYPTGWDKTYALTHFDESKWDFWFVGDRCGIDGNDFEIFSALKTKDRAFETSGPPETIEIIDYYILRELGG